MAAACPNPYVLQPLPNVSVIIPAYRQAAPLARAIESVLLQTYRDFELQVVDDSGDESLRALVEKYAGVSYLAQPSQGPGAARNRGLELTRGRYVISLDHDDEWDASFLERAVNAMEELNADVVWMNFRICGMHNRTDCLKASPAGRSLFASQKSDSWMMTPEQARQFYLWRMAPLSNSALLLRREKLGAGWYEKAMVADDWLLMARLLINPELRAGLVATPSWTKYEDGSQHSLWSQDTGRRCVHDVTYAWQNFASAFNISDRKKVRLYLANLHYKLAYHCFWAADNAEARDNMRLGYRLAGITRQSLLLVVIFALRKLARALGLPPLSSLTRASKHPVSRA